MTDPTRGVLYPERLPRFARHGAEGAASALVSWFWVPQWTLPPGADSRQAVLSYPAANLVVEPDAVTLWGATTRASERVLTGSGWAVGAVLKPAAFARLCDAPHDLVDRHLVLDEPGLRDAVAREIPDDGRAARTVSDWLVGRIGAPTAEGLLANDMSALLMTDAAVLRVDDAARRLRVSVRTLQRLAHRTVGLPPAAMIRRRRLQEAAQRVREDPTVPLARVAAELGFADQAHLAADFRAVLAMKPSDYRAEH